MAQNFALSQAMLNYLRHFLLEMQFGHFVLHFCGVFLVPSKQCLYCSKSQSNRIDDDD